MDVVRWRHPKMPRLLEYNFPSIPPILTNTKTNKKHQNLKLGDFLTTFKELQVELFEPHLFQQNRKLVLFIPSKSYCSINIQQILLLFSFDEEPKKMENYVLRLIMLCLTRKFNICVEIITFLKIGVTYNFSCHPNASQHLYVIIDLFYFLLLFVH